MHRRSDGASSAGDSTAASLRTIGVDAIGSKKKNTFFYISKCISIYIPFYNSLYVYTRVYLYTRVYAYESTCSTPRHGAYPGPRRARVRVPDAPPASGGGRARHRPPATATSPRTPTGRYPPTTRKRQPRRGRAARQRRPATAGPRTETPAQEAESDRGGTPVRFFQTFVLSCMPRARARSPRRVSKVTFFFLLRFSICFAWPSVAFDDPSTCVLHRVRAILR